MIFIPRNIGVSDIVVKQKRVVYINDFHFDQNPEFMQGSDNITAIKTINDFVCGPMIDIEGVVGGIFYFYNSSQGSINMNTVKKMKAISKLLGGCNSLVEITAESLLIKIGL